MRGIKKWIYSLIVCCCIGVAFSFVQPEKTEVKASETSAQGITVEANAEDFGVSADPNTSGTRDQYIWNADKEGALYSFTPHFIASNQNVYWRTEHDWVVFSFDTKGKSLYGENVLWTNNAGYIYYGNSHEDTNLKVSTNGNGAVSGGYEIETRGDVGYMAYVMNVKQNSYYASLPEKVVFKKGFAIVLTDGTAFVLNEDYTVYKVNGHYMPAKNLAGLKALSGVEVEQVKVKKAEYSNNELTLAFDKNLNINYGNQAVVSTAITLNNSTISTYSGYIRTDAGNQNKIVYSNVSLSLTNEDELTVQNGFYTFFGANSAGTMYVVEVTEDYTVNYYNGEFTQEIPKLITGFSIQNETEKSVLGDELSLKVRYRYEDDSVSPLPLTDFTVNGFDKNKLGKQTVTVTANGITDSFEIEVIENYLVRYKAMINPMEYEIGESIGDVYVLGFYYNGVPVRYNISDGVIVTGFDSATGGKKVVTITYGEYQEQIEVKIKEANNAPTVEPETSDVSVDDGKKGCNGSVRTSYAVVGLSVFACVVCLFRKRRKEQK